MMNQYKNPIWWDSDNDFAWDHVKLAMKRDWEQRKYGQKPNTNQNIGYTAKPTSSIELIPPLGQLIFEELESAYRFGYGAHLKFGSKYPEWDNNLEIRLARDWRTMDPTRQQTWEQDRDAICYGWNFAVPDLIEHVI
jgi:hypothetical protein